MKTKKYRLICDHCGKKRDGSKLISLGAVQVDTAEVLDSRKICHECWDRASYGSVTGLSVGKLDW